MSGGSVLQPLRRRDFRRLWIAQTISIVGDKINQVGLIIMVGRLTGSVAQMGIVLAITFLPAALFGLLAGPLVDRWDRRRTMVAADLLRALLVAGIAAVAAAQAASGLVIGLAYLLAFASSTVSLFFEPSRMALVPSILTEDELLAANALDSTTQSVAELLGIGFGGALVATIGYGSAFWIDALTFLASAAFVASVSHRAVERVLPKLRVSVVWDDLKYGLQRIRHDGVLRGVTITYSAIALGAGAVMTLTLLLALNVYTTAWLSDALRLTIEEIATAAGLLVGSMAIGMAGTTGSGRKYLRGIITLGVLLMTFLLVPNIWIAALVFFAIGWANVYLNVPMVTLLQIHTEEETRGRVFAVRSTLTRVAAVIGLVGGGVAAQVYGVVPMVVALGVFFAIIGLLGFAMPRLRNA